MNSTRKSVNGPIKSHSFNQLIKSSFSELRLPWKNSAEILPQGMVPTKFLPDRRIAPGRVVTDLVNQNK